MSIEKLEHPNLLEELDEFAHPNEVGLNIPKAENYARIKHFCTGRIRSQYLDIKDVLCGGENWLDQKPTKNRKNLADYTLIRSLDFLC